MTPADIDSLPDGTMIYDAHGVVLGVVRDDQIMNGNRPSIPTRRLDIGRYRPRWKERGEYADLKAAGPVFVHDDMRGL
jgi:hypothetical protein